MRKMCKKENLLRRPIFTWLYYIDIYAGLVSGSSMIAKHLTKRETENVILLTVNFSFPDYTLWRR